MKEIIQTVRIKSQSTKTFIDVNKIDLFEHNFSCKCFSFLFFSFFISCHGYFLTLVQGHLYFNNFQHLLLHTILPTENTILPTERGWSGGAKVLGKLPVPGRPTNLDYSRTGAYCACSRCGWGLFGHFFSYLSLLFLSPSLSGRRPDIDWNTVSKGRKAQNNQPTKIANWKQISLDQREAKQSLRRWNHTWLNLSKSSSQEPN